MLVRPAIPAEAADIRALAVAALPLDPDAAELTDILRAAPGPRVALVSEAAGKLTGIVCAGLRPALSGGVHGHVDLLAVAPPARGTGAGTRLLGAA